MTAAVVFVIVGLCWRPVAGLSLAPAGCGLLREPVCIINTDNNNIMHKDLSYGNNIRFGYSGGLPTHTSAVPVVTG